MVTGLGRQKKGSTLAYNDENNNYKPLPFTTTRNSIGTRVNKEGLIEVVGNDVPRIDYTDSADGVLLLEPQSTNLVTYSESMNQYTVVNGTITPNALTSPDGTLNAVKFFENSSNSQHVFDTNTISVTSGTKYTISVFAKYSGRFLTLQGSTHLGSAFATFNLQNGTLEQQGVGTASIEQMSNDWYRCKLVVQMVSSGNCVASVLLNDSATGGRSRGYQGNGTSGVFLYGFQVESGSYPTSYIPTSGSTYQRQADTANGSGNSEVFNDSEGVLFADIAALNDDSTSRRITISDGSSNPNNLVCVDMSEYTNTIIGRIRTSNSEVAFLQSTSQKQTQKNKIAVKYKVNDFALWINGFEVDTDNNGAAPIGLSDLSLDRGNGNNDFYGKTKEIGYYDATLTDSELEYLTSYRSLNELVTELNLNTL